MTLRNAFLICLAFAAVLFTACNREYDPTPEHVDRVYPLNEGQYRIYHVVDTSYKSTGAGGLDASTYFKRERTGGTEEDLLGRTTHKLWVETSPDDLGTPTEPVYTWTFSSLWTQYADDNYAERIEGNTRYLVLKIPPYEGATWNGNLFNAEDVQTYEYINIDTAVTIRGIEYPNCVFVLQVPFRQPVLSPGGVFFLIEHAYEIYAPDIGKILRYSKYYVEQNGVVEEDSRIYYEELVSHN
jgi:hypothetical protein